MAGDSKTEKATSKKRRDERKKGNIFLSRDVVILVSLLGMFVVLKMFFPTIYGTLKKYLMEYMTMAGTLKDVSNDLTMQISQNFMLTFVKVAMLLLLVSVLLSVVATAFQTKLLFAAESFKPKFNRLSPLQGIKRMFSMKSAMEVVKGLIKITILFVMIIQYIKKQIIHFPDFLTMDIIPSCVYMLDAAFGMVLNIGIAFAAISVFDYFYQWWDYERQLKMSKQEVKEEYKQLEGDPKVKGKIKELQRKMAMSRMMQSVPSADVVVKNPTHFAVALKYDPERNTAPVVVAKGQDELALRIIKVAEENQVYVIENKPLARALYATTEVRQQIPPDYYGAIAEILVYVYKLKNKLK